jgi:sucrose phosphorylase
VEDVLTDQGTFQQQMEEILDILYPDKNVGMILSRIIRAVEKYQTHPEIVKKRKAYKDRIVLSEDDAVLITYADSIFKEGERPLRTLHRFLKAHVKSAISTVHILPFFKSSSDGGFSVMDYRQVDPRLGDWHDIQAIGKDYRLMVDLVLNHVSSRSVWFQGFLKGDRRYRRYFLSFDKPVDVSEVFRPRTHPLLTRFETEMGVKYVWTTFSQDQIDLNFHHPEVLLEIIDILMYYLSKGVEFIRLDAIGYVWKELGTRCVNLPQTHEIVKLLRTILEYVAPYAVLVAEANFPYKENVSYVEARHEASLAYHFALPPIVIDAFIHEDTSILQQETARIREDLLFMNFLSSHDGIGLTSAKEILPQDRFETLLETIRAHGGRISYRGSAESSTPYELNITYYDAINDPSTPDMEADVHRFKAASSIALVDKGIPAIYIHCLLGSRNDMEGVEKTGENRMINREKLSFEKLSQDLSDPGSIPYRVLTKTVSLLNVRKEIPAFHHSIKREILSSDRRLFIMDRREERENMAAVINVSSEQIPLPQYKGRTDRIRNTSFEGIVEPYGVYFLE